MLFCFFFSSKVNAERTRKQSKAEDDRYNLKIFLDPNISSKDSNGIEGEESSSSSSEETDSEQVSESEVCNIEIGFLCYLINIVFHHP